MDLLGSTIEFGNIEESSFSHDLNTKYAASKKVIMVDENTHDYCLEYILTTFTELESAEVILLPNGEENKVMEVCFQVWEALSEYRINRNDLIINLGGGVVTDMGGFIASIFKRGVHFINIPTSLLGMVDAALGGKTGIDLGMYKNQLGTFTLPVATYIDHRFLNTLPQEEWVNGFAEMLKHGLIADFAFWKKLKSLTPETFSDLATWESLIQEAASIKVAHVVDDITEKGKRKNLNFGHTVGHAIEGSFLVEENPISHGVAVAYGMLGEAYISFKRGMLQKEELYEIVEVILAYYPNPGHLGPYVATILALMTNDKKNDAEGIKCVLLNKIGAATYDQLIIEIEIKEALDFIEEVYLNWSN